jgi:hypothetical protein
MTQPTARAVVDGPTSVRGFDWKQPFGAAVHGEPRLTAAANDATAKPGTQMSVDKMEQSSN